MSDFEEFKIKTRFLKKSWRHPTSKGEESWESVSIIGRGNYGEVWLQRRTDATNVLRAVKIIPARDNIDMTKVNNREPLALATLSKVIFLSLHIPDIQC